MKKIGLIITLSLIIFACSKPTPLSRRDKAIQAAKAYFKMDSTKPPEFSKLDSVIDYLDEHLLQIAQAKQQLMLKQDTLAAQKRYDSLLALPKTKYYVINYLDITSNNWHMVVMDTTFKI